MALCLDAQLVVSKTDPMLRSLVRRVPLEESEPKRLLLLPLGQMNDGVTVAKSPFHSKCPARW
jgi:hypothetical protein